MGDGGVMFYGRGILGGDSVLTTDADWDTYIIHKKPENTINSDYLTTKITYEAPPNVTSTYAEMKNYGAPSVIWGSRR